MILQPKKARIAGAFFAGKALQNMRRQCGNGGAGGDKPPTLASKFESEKAVTNYFPHSQIQAPSPTLNTTV